MKKAPEQKNESEIREEYDFSRGERGKYARRYARGANVIVLEPDVAKVFPNAAAVNDSLRALAGIIRRQHKQSAIK
jgi:hypothetical protein